METAPGHCTSHSAGKVRLCSDFVSLCVSCREPGLPSSVYTDPARTLQTQPKAVLRAQTAVRSRLTLQGMLKVKDWFAQKHLGIHSVISCSPEKWQLMYCVHKPWQQEAEEGHDRSTAPHEKCPFLSLHSAEQIIKPSPLLSMSWYGVSNGDLETKPLMSQVPDVLGQSYGLYPLKWTKAAHVSPPPQNTAKTRESDGLRIREKSGFLGSIFTLHWSLLDFRITYHVFCVLSKTSVMSFILIFLTHKN